MDLDRLTTGEKIAGVSAILLFIFTFFDWFGVKATGAAGSITVPGGGSAWDALDIIPWIIVLAVIAVLVMVYVKASDAAVDAPLTAIATGLSGLVVLLILYRVISPPDYDTLAGSFDGTRKAGLWLGLIASIGMAYGSYRAMEEEGSSFSDAADRFSGGGGGSGAGGGAPPRPPARPSEPPSAPPPPPPPPSPGV
jgi:uncharacterized membrane protein YgcG